MGEVLGNCEWEKLHGKLSMGGVCGKLSKGEGVQGKLFEGSYHSIDHTSICEILLIHFSNEQVKEHVICKHFLI